MRKTLRISFERFQRISYVCLTFSPSILKTFDFSALTPRLVQCVPCLTFKLEGNLTLTVVHYDIARMMSLDMSNHLKIFNQEKVS